MEHPDKRNNIAAAIFSFNRPNGRKEVPESLERNMVLDVETNAYLPGTFESGINESSSGSNAVNIANAVVSTAITAAVNAAR